MANQDYGILDDVEQEASYHKQRILPVENRPLKRTLDRLFSPSSLIFRSAQSLNEKGTTKEDRDQWRDDMLLELASLESAMVRIQFLRQSNDIECARYAQQTVKIQNQSQAIRDNIVELNVELSEAQKTLALRKEYDQLTDKILDNKMLKSREEQHGLIEKLEIEIRELQEETQQYDRTWKERREEFSRIVDQGKQMLKQIKDEKEEAERKEGMEGADDEQESEARKAASVAPTPRNGGSTPLPGEETGDTQDGLLKPSFRIASPSRTGSRAASPLPIRKEDVEMIEANTQVNTPTATVLSSGLEEGEAEEDEDMGGVEE